MKANSVSIKIIFAASLALLASLQSFAEENYFRWTDAQGVVHYGSRPPDNVNAVKINTFGKSRGSQINDGQSQKNLAGAVSPAEKAQQELKDQRAKQCEEEKKRLSLLTNSGSRIKMQQADGSTRYLSPEELAKEISSSQEFVDQACK